MTDKANNKAVINVLKARLLQKGLNPGIIRTFGAYTIIVNKEHYTFPDKEWLDTLRDSGNIVREMAGHDK